MFSSSLIVIVCVFVCVRASSTGWTQSGGQTTHPLTRLVTYDISAYTALPPRVCRQQLFLLLPLLRKDLLRCRVLTSGIFETRFQVDKVNFQ